MGRDKHGSVYRYNPVSESCSVPAELPYPIVYGTLVSGESFLYYTGGCDGQTLRNEILRIDTGNGHVSTLAFLQEPLQYMSSFILDGVLYIAGGEDACRSPLRIRQPPAGTDTCTSSVVRKPKQNGKSGFCDTTPTPVKPRICCSRVSHVGEIEGFPSADYA